MIKDDLIAARGLIKQKRYDEARALLLTIDHPAARQWLDRLDAMLQKDNPAERSTGELIMARQQPGWDAGLNHTVDLAMPEWLVQRSQPEPDTPAGRPWNPEVLLWPIRLLLTPVVAILLALNWRRLGRPAWGWITLVALLLPLVIGFAGAIALFRFIDGKNPIAGAPYLLPMVLPFIVHLGAILYVVELQNGAYAHWFQRRDVRGMVAHRYPFRRAAVQPAVISVAIAGLFLAIQLFVLHDMRPRAFSESGVTLTYPGRWEPVSFALDPACRQRDFECLLVLEQGDIYPSYVTLSRFSIPEPMTASDLEYRIFDQILFDYEGGIETLDRTTETINGYEAAIRSYTLPDDDDPEITWYVRHVYIVIDRTVYNVYATAECSCLYEDMDDIEAIYRSLQFAEGEAGIPSA